MLSLKHHYLTICLLLSFASVATAQNTPLEDFKPTHAKTYQTMVGQVNTLCLFVHTARDSWNEEEMETYLDMLATSQEWIIEQAGRYGKQLYFKDDRFLNNFKPIYIRQVYPGSSRITLQAVMEQLDFRNLDHFLEWHHFNMKKEKLNVILFVKDNGRSHAYNHFSHDEVDVAIVYDRNYGIPSDHYVISHELLHLFGAWDLYHGNSQSEEKAALAKSLYPHSIMINTFHDQERLEVDELTAWRLGWNDNFKTDYMQFRPDWKDRSRDHIDDIHWRFSLVRERDSEGNIIKKAPRGANSIARKAFLFGIEKVYGMGLSFTDGHKPGYVAPFGAFLEYKLSNRLYLGLGINGHKAGYHTIRNMDKVELRPELLSWLPGSGTTYEGDILTRRNVTVNFTEYPLRVTYVLQHRKSMEWVVSQSIGLNRYNGLYRVSYYWYQSENEARRREYPGYYSKYSKNYLGFTTGFGIRKSLLRRWHLNLNLQLNYLGFRGEHEPVDPEEYQTAYIGLNIGMKYNFRNELYDLPLTN